MTLSAKPAASFRQHFQCSPFHNPIGSHFLPSISNLLKSYPEIDLPTRRQKATSPKLLRHMYTLDKDSDIINFITAQLAMSGLFFAMRLCEPVKTPAPGKTKIVALNGCTFRCKTNVRYHIPPNSSHCRVHHHYLEGPEKWRSYGLHVPTSNRRPNTVPRYCLCLPDSLHSPHGPQLQPLQSMPSTWTAVIVPSSRSFSAINSAWPASFVAASTHSASTPMRSAPSPSGSGATMSLFIIDHHPHKIMILGRWSAEAFLVYIRPQVLERVADY